MSRETTNKLLEAIEDGWLNARDIVLMCLKYMSEEDVEKMLRANEVSLEAQKDESFAYLVFVGNSKDDLQPYLAFPDDTAAIEGAKNALGFYNYTEAVYMPEDDVDTNEVIWRSWEVK